MIAVSTPSRVCLLGEHQDYFGLPVITVAIDRRIRFQARPAKHKTFRIELKNLGERDEIPLAGAAKYRKERDYLLSGVNVVRRLGWRFSKGWDLEISSDIPMGKGVSSSSALSVGWFHTLGWMAEPPSTPSAYELAEGGFRIEVEEFQEPGGRMDHYAVAFGGVLHITFDARPRVTPLNNLIEGLVLGDSGKVKDTLNLLAAIKRDVHVAVDGVRDLAPDFDLSRTPLDTVYDLTKRVGGVPGDRLLATVETRDLAVRGKALLQEEGFRLEDLGHLLNLHHESLRDHLGISTPVIERLREAALKAGALGVKISGSGAGGCFVVLAPGKVEAVVEAVRSAGGDAFPIKVDEGSRVEGLE